MRQLMYRGPRTAVWEEAPEPVLAGTVDGLVRPLSVTACDLDGLIMQGKIPMQPFPLGHEFVAEVVAVGEEVSRFTAGDRVIVPFEISCGSCDHCRRGLTANCLSVDKNAMYGLGSFSGGEYGGALADLVRVPFVDAMCVHAPAHAGAAAAALGDNVTDAYRGLGPFVDEDDPEPVLVVSGGSIGIAAVAIAKALGAPEVAYVDTDPARLARAEQLGASVFEAREGAFPRRQGRYRTVVCSALDPSAVSCALRSTLPGAHCTITAMFDREVAIPALYLYDTGVSIHTGRAHIRRDLPAVLELVNDGRLDLEPLIQSSANWDEADQAYSDLRDKLLVTRS